MLHGVLSEEHCNKLISEAKSCGFSFWDGEPRGMGGEEEVMILGEGSLGLERRGRGGA